MNIFMNDLRILVDQKETEKKHDIKIAVRVPSLPEDAIKWKLNPVYWAQKGYVDAIMPTNFDSYDNDIPVEVWKDKIGKGHEIMFLPGTSYFEYETSWGTGNRLSQTAEGLRAITVNACFRGGDGIYLYNFFNASDFNQKKLRKMVL
ncbi:MAG: hypothetical protein HC905_05270 [Bacteroidales bacterium]|nr:hypothetical protein [Bacteroidales bacterium]